MKPAARRAHALITVHLRTCWRFLCGKFSGLFA